jgi:hypothetical protein
MKAQTKAVPEVGLYLVETYSGDARSLGGGPRHIRLSHHAARSTGVFRDTLHTSSCPVGDATGLRRAFTLPGGCRPRSAAPNTFLRYPSGTPPRTAAGPAASRRNRAVRPVGLGAEASVHPLYGAPSDGCGSVSRC